MSPIAVTIAACALSLSLCPVVMVGNARSDPPAPETAPAAPAVPVGANAAEATIRVLRTREVRQSVEPGATLKSPQLFSDDGPKVGSWLMFDLALEGIPDSSRLVSVELLSACAKDDLGTDLVGPMIAQASGNTKEWQERSILVHDDAPSIRWFVTAPPRTASTVDGSLVVRAKMAAKRDTLVLRPTQTWQKLDHPSVNGLNAEYRWSNVAGLGPYLEVRPREAAEYVYSFSPRPPQFRGRAKYSGADSKGVQYLLTKDTAESSEVKVQILGDVKTVEATLTMKTHELPK